MAEDKVGETRSNASPMDTDAEDVCWICLDDGSQDADQPLMSPCRCPRKVHPKCLARWQLQQAGRPEETQCRFCHSTLADWKQSLTPAALKPDVQKVQPIMVVYFEGEIHRIPVKQGSDGLSEFTTRIRELFRLPEDVDISLTFGCKEPMSGQHLKLEGMGAFDAAVHCASVAAAERQHKIRSGGGAAPAPASGGGAGTSAGVRTSAGGSGEAAPGVQGPATEAGALLPPVGHSTQPVEMVEAHNQAQPPLVPMPRQHQSHSHGGMGHHSTPRNPAAGTPSLPFMPAPSSGGGAHRSVGYAPMRRVPPAAAMLQTVESGNVMMPTGHAMGGAMVPSAPGPFTSSGSPAGGSSPALSQQLPWVLQEQESAPVGLSQQLSQELSQPVGRSTMAGSSSQGRYRVTRSSSSSATTLGELAGGCDPALVTPDPSLHAPTSLLDPSNAPAAAPTSQYVSQPASQLPNPYVQYGHAAAYSAQYGPDVSQPSQQQVAALNGAMPHITPGLDHQAADHQSTLVLPPLRTNSSWTSSGSIPAQHDGMHGASMLPYSSSPSAGCNDSAGADGMGLHPLAYAYTPSASGGMSAGSYAPSTPTLSPTPSANASPNGSAGGAPPSPTHHHLPCTAWHTSPFRSLTSSPSGPNVTATITAPFMPAPFPVPGSQLAGSPQGATGAQGVASSHYGSGSQHQQHLRVRSPGTRRPRASRSRDRDAAKMRALGAVSPSSSSGPSSPSSTSTGGAASDAGKQQCGAAAMDPCAISPAGFTPSLLSSDGVSMASVGSLTGRLKCSLRAFSRKVARSLHLSQQHTSAAAMAQVMNPNALVGPSAVSGGGALPQPLMPVHPVAYRVTADI